MCGIAGLIGGERTDGPAVVKRMLDLQVHRGPDGGGLIELSGTGGAVGSRRLAILDVDRADQPMVNPDTKDVLVFNGEIYNFKPLRSELEQKGFKFRTVGDTEVLLRALEHWGVGCLERLQGMFAFAFWKSRDRSLLLARDPMGIKPLYYSANRSKGFAFASEVKSLTISGAVPADIDESGLRGYLAFGAVPEPTTIIRGIKMLAAGSWLEVSETGEQIGDRTYWSFPQPGKGGSTGTVERIIEQSVAEHLQSDVPLGIFLSSGFDSTTVLGLARRIDPGRALAFTVSFPEANEYNEGEVAGAVASKNNTPHSIFPMKESTVRSWAVASLGAMDQPAADGMNTYIVARAARIQGMTVALSGLGGDELFGGYPSFEKIPRWVKSMGLVSHLPSRVRVAAAAIATARRDPSATSKARDIAGTDGDLLDLYLTFRRNLSNEDMNELGFSPDKNEGRSYFPSDADLASHVVEGDPIASVSRLESAFYMRNALLRDSDVFGMANSLEIRVPFVHKPVVEWAMGLEGPTLLPNGKADKHLIRKLAANFAVSQQSNAPKKGFVLPLGPWMEGPLRDLAQDSLADLKGAGVVDANGLDRVVTRLSTSRAPGPSFRLWSLVALGIWMKSRSFGPYATHAQ